MVAQPIATAHIQQATMQQTDDTSWLVRPFSACRHHPPELWDDGFKPRAVLWSLRPAALQKGDVAIQCSKGGGVGAGQLVAGRDVQAAAARHMGDQLPRVGGRPGQLPSEELPHHHAAAPRRRRGTVVEVAGTAATPHPSILLHRIGQHLHNTFISSMSCGRRHTPEGIDIRCLVGALPPHDLGGQPPAGWRPFEAAAELAVYTSQAAAALWGSSSMGGRRRQPGAQAAAAAGPYHNQLCQAAHLGFIAAMLEDLVLSSRILDRLKSE